MFWWITLTPRVALLEENQECHRIPRRQFTVLKWFQNRDICCRRRFNPSHDFGVDESSQYCSEKLESSFIR